MKPMNPVSEPDTWAAATTADLIRTECESIAGMLIEKNSAYGDSALDPVRIFSTADTTEQIKVRIDDKLSRLQRGSAAGEDTVLDLVGYLVLLRVAQTRHRRLDHARHELGLPTLTPVPLEETLQSAPGPDPDGGIQLTDAEHASLIPVEPDGNPDRLPRTLTAADPEPSAGSVVLDRDGDAWGFGPLTLIHEGNEV